MEFCVRFLMNWKKCEELLEYGSATAVYPALPFAHFHHFHLFMTCPLFDGANGEDERMEKNIIFTITISDCYTHMGHMNVALNYGYIYVGGVILNGRQRSPNTPFPPAL